jgi:hypothetical protein
VEVLAQELPFEVEPAKEPEPAEVQSHQTEGHQQETETEPEKPVEEPGQQETETGMLKRWKDWIMKRMKEAMTDE